ncbi:uncharacterized protein F5147DRAFT_570836, partial [Suillus discolor]
RSPSPSSRNKSARQDKTPRSSAGFSNGAHGQRSPAVCAICLGHNNHPFAECPADRLWDNSYSTISKWVLRHSDKPLCVDWQRGRSCPSRLHDERHLCSGCLSLSHGAQNCPRAQTLSSSVSL